MRRKEITWIVVLLVLGFVYARYFTSWFVKRPMMIRVTQRHARHGTTEPVYFVLSDKYKLTSVEVIPITGEKFNPLDRPVWHLVSASNSVPVRAFSYGQHIRGMIPAITNIAPDPLTPGMPYRLLIAAGPVTGSIDFEMKSP